MIHYCIYGPWPNIRAIRDAAGHCQMPWPRKALSVFLQTDIIANHLLFTNQVKSRLSPNLKNRQNGGNPRNHRRGGAVMPVKQILDDFQKREAAHQERRREFEQQTQKDVEKRLGRLSRCFEDIILPAVRDVERDLQAAGFWHKISLSQFSSPLNRTPVTREVLFYFYPEKYQRAYHSQRVIDASYKACFRSSGDYRKVSFLLQFPRRLLQTTEMNESVYAIEDIDKQSVDAVLEAFIKGAIEGYQSDRALL
jgi:hypothetical protein